MEMCCHTRTSVIQYSIHLNPKPPTLHTQRRPPGFGDQEPGESRRNQEGARLPEGLRRDTARGLILPGVCESVRKRHHQAQVSHPYVGECCW